VTQEPKESLSRYLIGIDLGTTNTALAFVDRKAGRSARAIKQFPIPQLSAPGEISARDMLPSVAYVLGEHDLAAEQAKLPWKDAPRPSELVLGELARARGAVVPGRLIASAKSWLCHPGVDRKAQILPWGSDADVPKRSPVEASTAYLSHLREAWDAQVAQGDATKILAAQEIVLTVPASFDEVARELTLEAAKRAGLRPYLLEEPQAALYAWIAAHESDAMSVLAPGEQVLVVDVGGGTTDFSLVAVKAHEEEGLTFERTAVGDHLLLGGDNMDLALARKVEERLLGGERLDVARWSALAYACRKAKEDLLAQGRDAKQAVVVPGRGSKIIGGTLSTDLTGTDVEKEITEAFFPLVARDEPPLKRARTGLQELGLPYVSETAVTRHLRAFLARHGHDGKLAHVDWVLFNGGVMKARILRERIVDALERWFEKRPRVLDAVDLDLAVSRGAAYYALVRRGKGMRIKSGAGHAYYVEVAGVSKTERSALCLIPRGLEPLKDVKIEERPLELRANAPAAFPFFGSSFREDKPGALVAVDEDMDELPPIHTVIRLKKRSSQRTSIPVTLSARLTELGTLELWCQARDSERRWKLEFDTRGQGTGPVSEVTAPTDEDVVPLDPTEDVIPGATVDPEKVGSAVALVKEAFEVSPGESKRLERLGKELEGVLGQPREALPVPVIRKIFDALLEVRATRTRSPEHEARWLNLAGFCIRPGFGAALDEHRAVELWKLKLQGLSNPSRDACRLEWLVMWRRAAGGIGKGQQEEIFGEIQPFLLGGKRGGVPKQEAAELWRTAASLELLSPRKKQDLGEALLKLLEEGKAPPRWGPWALGRLGAREPLYGPLDRLVPADKATGWLERALKLPKRDIDELAFALVQLGRLTGDRSRDVPEALRQRARSRVLELVKDPRIARPLEEVVSSERRTEGAFYGDSVPVGLVLAK
jgi:molecular chaperone DnaK (HSP70)